MVGVIGLAASLELLLSLGAEKIEQRVLALTDFACQRLQDIGCTLASLRDRPEHSSGILLFDLPGCDPQQVRRELLAKKCVISVRAGKLRISPHGYANEADIERLIEALDSCNT